VDGGHGAEACTRLHHCFSSRLQRIDYDSASHDCEAPKFFVVRLRRRPATSNPGGREGAADAQA
jgi:hypothetical protein